MKKVKCQGLFCLFFFCITQIATSVLETEARTPSCHTSQGLWLLLLLRTATAGAVLRAHQTLMRLCPCCLTPRPSRSPDTPPEQQLPPSPPPSSKHQERSLICRLFSQRKSIGNLKTSFLFANKASCSVEGTRRRESR